MSHGLSVEICAGSDSAQISTLNPWLMIYFMVTGNNSSGTLINPGQRISRMDALRLYTAENGWFFHEEDQLGSIEPGKLGDLVVLTDDSLVRVMDVSTGTTRLTIKALECLLPAPRPAQARR